jgi:hypothetical protein
LVETLIVEQLAEENGDFIYESQDMYNSGSISHELYDNFIKRTKISKPSCEYEFEMVNYFETAID